LAFGFVLLFFAFVLLAEVFGAGLSLTFFFAATFELEGVLITATAFTFVFTLDLLVALDLGFALDLAISLVLAFAFGIFLFAVFDLTAEFGEGLAFVLIGLALAFALVVVFAFFLALVAGVFFRFAAIVSFHSLCHDKTDQNRAAHLTRTFDFRQVTIGLIVGHIWLACIYYGPGLRGLMGNKSGWQRLRKPEPSDSA
jgi:hypothetical protein